MGIILTLPWKQPWQVGKYHSNPVAHVPHGLRPPKEKSQQGSPALLEELSPFWSNPLRSWEGFLLMQPFSQVRGWQHRGEPSQ